MSSATHHFYHVQADSCPRSTTLSRLVKAEWLLAEFTLKSVKGTSCARYGRFCTVIVRAPDPGKSAWSSMTKRATDLLLLTVPWDIIICTGTTKSFSVPCNSSPVPRKISSSNHLCLRYTLRALCPWVETHASTSVLSLPSVSPRYSVNPSPIFRFRSRRWKIRHAFRAQGLASSCQMSNAPSTRLPASVASNILLGVLSGRHRR